MEDDVTPPRESISMLNEILASEETSLTTQNILEANVLKAELLIYLEEIELAGQIAQQYLPGAIKNNVEKLIVRLKLVELAVLDKGGYSEITEHKISALLEHAEKFNDSIAQGDIYIAVGHSRYLSGNLDKALIMFQKSYDIYAKHNDDSKLSLALNSLANLYSDLNDLDTAIQYLIEAVDIKRSLNDEMSVSIMLYNLGMSYLTNNDFQSALAALSESLQISASLEDSIGILWTKQAIADIRLKQNKPNEAITFYLETEKHFAETGDKRMHYQAVKGLFDSYILLGDSSKAKATLSKTPALLASLNSDAYDADYLKRSAQLAFINAEYKNAYLLQTQYSEARTTLFTQEKEQDIQKQRVKFDSEIKDNKNQILSRDNELKALRIIQHEKQNQLWIVVIVFALSFTIFIGFFLYRQTINKNLFKTMSLKDHLTDSPNRRAILEKAQAIWVTASTNHTELFIAIVDLDLFKKINDVYGHDIGDEVLKSFALSCKKCFRKNDHFGRYGGEEWLFVMENNEQQEIEQIFQRLHIELNSRKISGLPIDKAITFSVGVTKLSASTSKSLKLLISKADENLYKAKENGRNHIAFDSSSYPFS